MAVYIDKMNRKYRNMIMCHMLADTSEELEAMRICINLNKRWIQYPGTYKEHYDICLEYKRKAIEAGAIEVDRKYVGTLLKQKRSLFSEGIDIIKI